MDIKIELTIRGMCLYEQLTGKSFFAPVGSEEDALKQLYAIFVTSNDMTITFPVFASMMGNRKFAKAVTDGYMQVSKYLEQFNINKKFADYAKNAPGSKDNKATEEMTVTKLASALIVQHHIDADYVMSKMSLWEIIPYLEVADAMKKEELTEERLWTYLSILPHVDGKKLSGPDKLLKFTWETDSAQKDLDAKSGKIKSFFEHQKQAKKQKEEQQNGNG